MKKYILFAILVMFTYISYAQTTYKLDKDVSYVSSSETDSYKLERCKVDVYYPENKDKFSTLIWFHGGGMEMGEKYIPEEIKNKGIAVVSVNYRLSPKVKNPAYTEDAAEAVAWVFNNIGQYGGDVNHIFVSGHSAGGYLTLMLALDTTFLSEYNINANDVAAYLPVSGQTLTHFTIKKERGLSFTKPVIDEYAPVSYASKKTSPIILITGDRNLEMANRWEENTLLYSLLKNEGNTTVKQYELSGFNHGTVVAPAVCLIANYINNFK